MSEPLTRTEAHAALDEAVGLVADDFADESPARVEALKAHAATCHMIVDHCFDDREVAEAAE
jgi:hypothetical protein